MRDGIDDRQASMNGSLGVVLVRGWVSETGKYAISHVSEDRSPEASDEMSAAGLVGLKDRLQIFRIELRGQRGRVDQITEHDCELSSFALAISIVIEEDRRRVRIDGRCGWRIQRNHSGKFFSLTQRQSKFFEIAIGQAMKYINVNIIVLEETSQMA